MTQSEIRNFVHTLYVAYCGRPAGPVEFDFWYKRLAANENLSYALTEEFALSEEPSQEYEGYTDEIFVIQKACQNCYSEQAPASVIEALQGHDKHMLPYMIGFGYIGIDTNIISAKCAASDAVVQALDPNRDGQPPFLADYTSQHWPCARSWLAQITQITSDEDLSIRVNEFLELCLSVQQGDPPSDPPDDSPCGQPRPQFSLSLTFPTTLSPIAGLALVEACTATLTNEGQTTCLTNRFPSCKIAGKGCNE